jgi:hypothetical protein
MNHNISYLQSNSVCVAEQKNRDALLCELESLTYDFSLDAISEDKRFVFNLLQYDTEQWTTVENIIQFSNSYSIII